MNPTKSFLGVSSGKFLGFIVTSKGMHLDPDKVKAIQNMQPPKNLKELRVCKVGWPISEDSLQISWVVVNHSPGLWKKLSLLYGIKLARRLSKILKNTPLSLQSCGSHIRKSILALCKSYGPFSRCSSYPEEWWRSWICHFLSEQDPDRCLIASKCSENYHVALGQ